MKKLSYKVTITGDLGSGKSAVSQLLEKKLGIKRYSTGSIQREMAKEKGMTTLELNRYAEKNRNVDDTIDGFSRKLAKQSKGFVLDARMGWYFIPDSFKIYLFVQDNIAAKRIYQDTDRKNELYTSLAETERSVLSRRQSEWERFKNLYAVDLSSIHQYNMVIDTSYVSSEGVANSILSVLEQDREGGVGTQKNVCFALPHFIKRALSDSKFEADFLDKIPRSLRTVRDFYNHFEALYKEHEKEKVGNETLFTINFPISQPNVKPPSE